jgi:adenylate cyclase
MRPAVEIERKFLVDPLPRNLEAHPSSQIDQGYIAITDEGVEVRIRRYGEHSFLTVKSGGMTVRVEEEFEIDEQRFRALWPLTEGRRISKRRYLIPSDRGGTIELDVYDGALSGLATAEMEFDSEAAAAAFTPPGWLGRDVTEEPAYKNKRLALDGLPEHHLR